MSTFIDLGETLVNKAHVSKVEKYVYGTPDALSPNIQGYGLRIYISKVHLNNDVVSNPFHIHRNTESERDTLYKQFLEK